MTTEPFPGPTPGERGVQVVRGDQLPEAEVTTPGLTRETAFDTGHVLLSRTRLDPGFESGWHHHAERATYAVVVDGRLRLDHGADGDEAVVGGPGDLAITPPGVVHRDVNAGDGELVVVAAFVGPGEPVVNVGGPHGSNAPPIVIAAGDGDAAPPVGGVVRRSPELTTPSRQVREYVPPATTTDWRHFGENEAFASVLDGAGTIEWSRTGDRRATVGTGDFLRIAPGFTHRLVTPAETGLELVTWIVGPEPGVYPVDQPGVDP